MREKFFFILSLILCCSRVFGGCTDNSRVSYVFLNGVRNSETQVKESLVEMGKVLKKNHNYLKAQVPTVNDLCVDYLYNQTDSYIDFVETFGQKFKEHQLHYSVPFSWKLVSKFIFAIDSLQEYGFESPFLVSLYVNMINAIDLASEQEQQTLNEITAKAGPMLEARSLVVISHSQGNLFANLLSQKLQALYPGRMNYYANLQVGSAAKSIDAPNGDYYTSQRDVVISSLRLLRPTLAANFTLNFSWKDFFFQHDFVDIYIRPDLKVEQTYTSGIEVGQSAEDIFLNKLTTLAAIVVDHKCGIESYFIGETTYPVLNPDGTSGGYRSYSSKLIGNVYLTDGAAVCDSSVVDAGFAGEIRISGSETMIEEANIKIIGGMTNKISLHNVTGWEYTIEETEDGSIQNYETAIKDTFIGRYTTIRDSIVESAYVDGLLQNSVVKQGSSSGTVTGSTITESGAGGIITDSKIMSGTRVQGNKVVNSTLISTWVDKSDLSNVYADTCSFVQETVSNVNCKDYKNY